MRWPRAWASPSPTSRFHFLVAERSPRTANAVHAGNVVYEGELGIVIGRRCSNVSEAEAAHHIFGYTCVDDVTAADLIPKNPTFAQWARAKSFDTFGVFGPVIATGLDPTGLSIRTVLDGQERQNYPVSDMIFQPHRLVSFLSRDMTLLPGDVIACAPRSASAPCAAPATPSRSGSRASAP